MKISWIGFSLLILSVFFLSSSHNEWLPGLASLIVLMLFCLSALPFTRILFPDRIDSAILAFPAGYVLHAVLLSIAAAVLGMYRITVILYIVVAILISLLLYRGKKNSVPDTDWTRNDFLQLWLWLFITLALVALPFARVGELTSDGFAYRAYFNADFFRNMAVSGALSKTGIPPDNPYLAGNPLHYYWFFHLLPAFWNQMFPAYRPDFLLVQFSLAALLMFVGTFFVVVRRFVQNRKTLLFLLPVFAIGGSYEGLYALQWLQKRNQPWHEFVNLNIDGIFRWNWKAPQIDTLYRALLYAPQHLLALSILLIALLIWNWQRLGKNPLEGTVRKVLFYSLIFSTLGFSAFIGSALIAGAALIVLIFFLKHPKQLGGELVLSGVMGLLFLAVYFYLFEMFQGGSQQFDFGPDKIILAHFFTYFLFNWGALLVLGLIGVFYKSQLLPNRILLFFLIFCFLLIFFVRIVLAGFSDISLKVGHFSHVILLLFAAGAIDRFLSQHPTKSRWLALMVFILVLPASITWCMDFWNSLDIQNRKFTTYLKPEEAEVCNWMSRNLPARAVVLNYSSRYEDFMRDIAPPFSQHSVFVGNRIFARIFQVPEQQVQDRNKIAASIYQSTAPQQTWILARNAGIEYIFVNDIDISKVQQKFSTPNFSILIQDGKTALFRVNSAER
jgi:hypothetical protein